MFGDSNFYHRNLPHWQPEGAEYFITFRLAGSLPKQIVAKIKRERELFLKEKLRKSDTLDSLADVRKYIQRQTFKKYEHILDDPNSGPTWLFQPKVAQIVKEAIHFRDQTEFELYTYCIMSNHVHLVFKLLQQQIATDRTTSGTEYPVTKILKSLKWYTAKECNKVLNRTGNSFWHPESYDHVIRDADERENIIFYTLQNPVKAGLVKNWNDWPNSWCKPSFLSSILGNNE